MGLWQMADRKKALGLHLRFCIRQEPGTTSKDDQPAISRKQKLASLLLLLLLLLRNVSRSS